MEGVLPSVGLPVRRVRTLFRLLAVGLGALHAWLAGRQQSMSEDGIAYLDIGDAFFRGDWAAAVNSVWSPLYAVVLGAAQQLVSPSLRWEFTVVQFTNFAIYLFALRCFEVFWRRLGEVRGTAGEPAFPSPHWWAVGYVVFIWSALCLIKIWVVTPDMLAAALLYLAAAQYLRLEAPGATARTWAGFGVLLALAYLAKSVMFLIGLGWLALALWSAHPVRRLRLAAAVSGFVLVAGPWVTTISVSKGRFTFGDAGRITYLKHVQGVPYPHWRAGAPDELGTPTHPARLIHEQPPVYEFATPVSGTYPMSHDPSYWFEGVAVRWRWDQQRAALLDAADFYAHQLVEQGGLVAVVLLMFLLAPPRLRLGAPDPRWGLVILAGAAFVLYALVYLETRYIAPFVILGWAGLLAQVADPAVPGARGVGRAGAVALVCVLLLNVGAFHVNLSGAGRPTGSGDECADCQAAASWEIATWLGAQGLQPGDPIGVIGYSFGAFFARLARVRIVAEIPADRVEQFWRADAATQASALEAFARAGVRAVVADWVPGGRAPVEWVRVGKTGHHVYMVPPQVGARR